MSIVNWAVAGALVLAGLYWTSRNYGLWAFETLVSWSLPTFNSGTLPGSKPVSGPRWQFPNGALIQRYIDGRRCSEVWRQYGPVYRLWNGPHPEIVITTPEDFKHFASDSGDHGKTHNLNMGWYIGQVLGQCLGFLVGSDYVRLRKIFDPAFTHSTAVSRIGPVSSAAKEYVEKLSNRASSGNDKDTVESFTVSVVDAFVKFPYFLTAQAIYGSMTETEENDLWHLTEKRLALNPYFFGGGLYRFAVTTRLFAHNAITQLEEFQDAWRDYNIRVIQTRQTQGRTAPIMTYWEEHEKGNMSLPELLQTLDELLMLNLDVITHVITWFITLVADHDRVKQELCEEITANYADLTQYITKTDTHLHRCFVESMRIRPFVAFTPGECSKEVKNFHGILVKPGTQVLLDVLSINVRNPFWGANSKAFDPSRFKNIKSSELRYNLHSFGIGSRKCMGQYIGAHIAKSLVLYLFNKYDVAVSKEDQGIEKGYDIDESSWTPKSGVYLRLTRR